MNTAETDYLEDVPQQQYHNTIADDSLGSLHYQIDHSDVIQEIETNLRNEKYYIDKQGHTRKTKKGQTPLINEQGIQTVITILKSYLNKINILSDLSNQDIQDTVKYIQEDLADDFYINWDKYGIKDYPTGSWIIHIVASSVNSTLRKGDNGNYLKLLRHMHQITEIQQASLRSKPQGGITERLQNFLMRKK